MSRKRGPISTSLLLSKSKRYAAAFLIVGAILGVYGPHIGNEFVFDDHSQIENNPYVIGDSPWGAVFFEDSWAYDRRDMGARRHIYFRPGFSMMNRLLFWAGGGGPKIYHVASVILFLVAIGLVFPLLGRLGLSSRQALATTALVAFHPMMGEAVFWAACLSELLILVGMLGAMYCVIIARELEGPRRYTMTFLACAVSLQGLLAKETAIVIPILLTVEALSRGREGMMTRLKFLGPVWVLTAGYLGWRTEVLNASGLGSLSRDLLWSVARTGFALLWDLRHLVLPFPLSTFHDLPRFANGFWDYLAGLAALVSILVFCVVVMWREKKLTLWLFWLFLPLLPRLVQLFFTWQTETVVAERYLVLSVVPTSVLFILGLERILSLATIAEQGKKFVVWGVVSLLCVSGGIYTHRYGAAFRNDNAYFEWAARIEPDHLEVIMWKALNLMEERRFAAALPVLERAADIEPRSAWVFLNLGITLRQLGRNVEAVQALLKGVWLDGKIGRAHLEIGNTLREMGKVDEAAKHYALELKIDPGNLMARLNLGTYRYLTGDVPGAVQIWSPLEDVAEMKAPEAYFNLGMAHRELGNNTLSTRYLLRFLEVAGDRYPLQKQQARQWLSGE